MSTTAEESSPTDSRPADGPAGEAGEAGTLVARASSSYRVRWGLIGLMFVAAGGWFAYDGWVKYPRENAEARRHGYETIPHSEGDDIVASALKGRDIPLQRLLAVCLPPVGLAMLAYMLYQSRGEYRLAGNVLHVPGHPPVPLANVRQIDETRWDRKGIVSLDYEDAAGAAGRLRLDDQRYAREQTDAIFDRIKAVLVPAADAAGGDAGDVEPPAEGPPADPDQPVEQV